MAQSAPVFRACGGLCKAIVFTCQAMPEGQTTTAWLSFGLMIIRRYWKRVEAPTGKHRTRMRKTSLTIVKRLILPLRSIPSFSGVLCFPTDGITTACTRPRTRPLSTYFGGVARRVMPDVICFTRG
jgi:hypothetical protein